MTTLEIEQNLARSKVLLAEAQAILNEHDRKYHPEYFDEEGNRKPTEGEKP